MGVEARHRRHVGFRGVANDKRIAAGGFVQHDSRLLLPTCRGPRFAQRRRRSNGRRCERRADAGPGQGLARFPARSARGRRRAKCRWAAPRPLRRLNPQRGEGRYGADDRRKPVCAAVDPNRSGSGECQLVVRMVQLGSSNLGRFDAARRTPAAKAAKSPRIYFPRRTRSFTKSASSPSLRISRHGSQSPF